MSCPYRTLSFSPIQSQVSGMSMRFPLPLLISVLFSPALPTLVFAPCSPLSYLTKFPLSTHIYLISPSKKDSTVLLWTLTAIWLLWLCGLKRGYPVLYG